MLFDLMYHQNIQVGDPLAQYTKIHLDGESFKDLSKYNRPISRGGGVYIDSSTPGNKSFYIPQGSFITCGNNSDMLLRLDDFTIEVDVYTTINSAQYGEGILSTYTYAGGQDNGWSLTINRSSAAQSTIGFYISKNNLGKALRYQSGLIPMNTWNKICVERKSGIGYIYLNDSLVASGDMNIDDSFIGTLGIGYVDGANPGHTTGAFAGKIDNLRILSGMTLKTK